MAIVQKSTEDLPKGEAQIIETRRARRARARRNKVAFEPEYNSFKGVTTFEEQYGVGYERFNSKYVTIKEKETEEA